MNGDWPNLMTGKSAPPAISAQGTVKHLDFIVIGASKSGTTSLFNYLRPHPQIYLPPDKELPFFARDEWFERGWDWFVHTFLKDAPPAALWGTVTPQYMEDGVRSPRRLFESMPQVKLIALLRNPVDRAFSTYRMRVRKEREARSFEKAVAEQLNPAALEKARQLPWNLETVMDCYLVTGEYGRILSQFIACFPPEQLLILFTDELEQRPQSVIDSVLTFIGLEPGFTPDNLGQRYYVGGEQKRFPWLIPLAQKMLPLKWVWHRLSQSRRRAILFWLKTEFNVKQTPPPTLSPQIRKKLVRFYQPDIEQLEKLLGYKPPWPEFYA